MGICIYRYWKHELIFGKRCIGHLKWSPRSCITYHLITSGVFMNKSVLGINHLKNELLF